MKTASVRELRNEFPKVARWLASGETVEIIKRGKAIAELVPKAEGKPRVLLGCTPSSLPLPDDLDAPPPAAWSPRETEE